MDKDNKGRGAIIGGESLRMYDYDIVAGSPASSVFPQVYEIPKEMHGVVKDQGSVGACVACVISTLAEVFHKIETGEDMEFSEGWIYGALRESNSNGWGMMVETAINHWNFFGAVPKTYFNQLFEMPEIKQIVQNNYPHLYDVATRYKIKGYTTLNRQGNVDRDTRIKDALTKYDYGLLAVSRRHFGESHCILLTGWNDKNDTYKIKNSWGTGYGNNGLAEIPKSAIDYVYLITDEKIEMKFTDVSKDAWYYNNIKNVYFSGLMKGVSEELFQPERPITRAECAAIVDRMAKLIDQRFEIVMNDIYNLRNNIV